MRAVAVRMREVRLDAVTAAPLATPALLVILLVISAVVRTRILDAGYWIDEGITVGISSHPFTHIPHVLRHDGAPPLYYLLLHFWMRAFGSGEPETHALSLTFSLIAIPVAYWAASSLFGRRAAWICAGLASVNPFLTVYAQETRMYSLVMLLSFATTAAFVHAFVYRRRRYVALTWALLVVLLYTHNWTFFFIAGIAAAIGALAWDAAPNERRLLLVDGALVLGGVAVAYIPWLPIFLFQLRHTGAPWSSTPGVTLLFGAPAAVLSGNGALMALLLSGGTGLLAIWSGRARRERRAIFAIAVLILVTILAGWISSRISPAWANRYLAIMLGPLLILAAAGLARAGRLGVVGLGFALMFWTFTGASPFKSNAREVAAAVTPEVHRGDLVISTHPEQIPVLHYYLPKGLRYANPMGMVHDPRFMNWNDALTRMRQAHPRSMFHKLTDGLKPGTKVVLITPVFHSYHGWDAPWTYMVYRRTLQWASLLGHDRGFTHDGTVALNEITAQRSYFKTLAADVYTKR